MFRKMKRRKEPQSIGDREDQELENLYLEICNGKLRVGPASIAPKEIEYVRVAASLMAKYDIKIGWCGFGVVAMLMKDNWINEINKGVPARQYQCPQDDLSDEEKDNMLFIAGYGRNSFVKAVFNCVMNARLAGVI